MRHAAAALLPAASVRLPPGAPPPWLPRRLPHGASLHPHRRVQAALRLPRQQLPHQQLPAAPPHRGLPWTPQRAVLPCQPPVLLQLLLPWPLLVLYQRFCVRQLLLLLVLRLP